MKKSMKEDFLRFLLTSVGEGKNATEIGIKITDMLCMDVYIDGAFWKTYEIKTSLQQNVVEEWLKEHESNFRQGCHHINISKIEDVEGDNVRTLLYAFNKGMVKDVNIKNFSLERDNLDHSIHLYLNNAGNEHIIIFSADAKAGNS